MQNFYYLICSLKNIALDIEQTPYTISDFLNIISEEKDLKDFGPITPFLYQYDNTNLINIMNKKEEFDNLGVFTKEELNNSKIIPSYMKDFLSNVNSGIRISKDISLEDELEIYYYNFIKKTPYDFLKKYIDFNFNLKNILAAINSKKHGLDTKKHVLPINEISTKLLTSKAVDFDLSKDIDYFNKISNLVEKNDLFELEKELDVMRYNFLEENLELEEFSVNYLLSYFIKLLIITRWNNIKKKNGTDIFKENTDKVAIKSNSLIDLILNN